MYALKILGLVLFINLLIWIPLFLWLKALAERRKREALEKIHASGAHVIKVVSGANFFGQESLGMLQIRGNGILILTSQELYFELWKPRRECRIPLSSIHTIETPRSHLGKSKGRKLLKLVFQNQEGQQDSAAWFVPDLNEFKPLLENLIYNEHDA